MRAGPAQTSAPPQQFIQKTRELANKQDEYFPHVSAVVHNEQLEIIVLAKE
jgi:hypothetical protein